MAWRVDDNGDIVINGWEKGIGSDPYSGIANLQQVNISTVPGEVSVGFPLSANTTSGGTLGRPIHRATQFASGLATAYYILDASSQVWKATSLTGTFTFLSTNNSTTGGLSTNQGLAFWKGYLFKFRNDAIDFLASGTSNWTAGTNQGQVGWKTITGTTSHYALVGQDDVLYFCNGQSVGSIIENAGKTFDPNDATTYTFNTSALLLPSNDSAQCLAESGVTLLVGGSQSAIYPWNRTAPTFNYPIFIADYFIKRMVTANTNVFIFPGNVTGRGRIYQTNGSQADLFYKLPDHIWNLQEPYYRWGDAMYYRNKLVFSFEVDSNASTQSTDDSGIYGIDLDTKAFSLLSTVTVGGVASALIPDQSGNAAAGMAYIAGTYNANSAYTISNSSTSAGTSGQYFVLSDAIPVGTFLKHKTFRTLEFKLAKPLAAGESISFSYITDLGNTTAIATFNTVGMFSGTTPVNFQSGQWLQIKSLGIAVSTGVRLKELRLR